MNNPGPVGGVNPFTGLTPPVIGGDEKSCPPNCGVTVSVVTPPGLGRSGPTTNSIIRDNFADPSSKEDPIQQIVRYVNQIREGKFKTPAGRDILVNSTTPFYGYVVCDLTPKVRKWLEFEQQFTPMPDGLGWFRWFGNISLHMEVISWTKLLRDAEMRNKVFFNKLGID